MKESKLQKRPMRSRLSMRISPSKTEVSMDSPVVHERGKVERLSSQQTSRMLPHKPLSKIKTSLLLSDGSFYKAMIYLPKLEYFVPCLNYCLIKSLSLFEFQEHS